MKPNKVGVSSIIRGHAQERDVASCEHEHSSFPESNSWGQLGPGEIQAWAEGSWHGGCLEVSTGIDARRITWKRSFQTGPKKSSNFLKWTKYIGPRSLEFSHWLNKETKQILTERQTNPETLHHVYCGRNGISCTILYQQI